MKYLIIPDLHHRWKTAEKIIAAEEHDIVIFLADYFDNFDDNAKIAERTAIWLKESLTKPNRIHLLGNHDLPLIVPNNFTLCSGWTPEKHKVVNKVLDYKDYNKLIPFYHIQDGNWLLSHAGIHPSIFEHPIRGINLKDIEFQCGKAFIDVRSGKRNDVFVAGMSSGGPHPFGGLTWLRWNELSPLKEFNQIVGHTILSAPQVKTLSKNGDVKILDFLQYYNYNEQYESESWNLDTNNRHYAVIDNGKVEIKLTLDIL